MHAKRLIEYVTVAVIVLPNEVLNSHCLLQDLSALQRLGKGLKDLPRDQIVLATKVGRYGPDAFANLFDWSAERVQGRF